MDFKNRNVLMKITKGYSATNKKSLWQLINTFIPFFMLYYLTFLVFNYSWLLLLPFIILLSLFKVRIFCLQHDCGHGSLFSSKIINNWCGIFCSVITTIPYEYWRYHHAQHHLQFGKLEKCGHAEYYVLTTEEYQHLNIFQKFCYKTLRNGFFLIFISPIFVMISNIFPFLGGKRYIKKALSGTISSCFIVSLYIGLGLIIGLKFFLIVTIPAIYFGAMLGSWLFYIQHNFENGYYQKEKNWSHGEASILGSSYCKMPAVLNWFTASIGFHHIHHINPNIPNYNLSLCQKNNIGLENKSFSIYESWKTLRANLWDIKQNKMISFYEYEKTKL